MKRHNLCQKILRFAACQVPSLFPPPFGHGTVCAGLKGNPSTAKPSCVHRQMLVDWPQLCVVGMNRSWPEQPWRQAVFHHMTPHVLWENVSLQFWSTCVGRFRQIGQKLNWFFWFQIDSTSQRSVPSRDPPPTRITSASTRNLFTRGKTQKLFLANSDHMSWAVRGVWICFHTKLLLTFCFFFSVFMQTSVHWICPCFTDTAVNSTRNSRWVRLRDKNSTEWIFFERHAFSDGLCPFT